MQRFDYYKHPAGNTRLILRGISWPAFWFLPLWALYHGMLSRAAALFGAWIFADLIALILLTLIGKEEGYLSIVVFVSPFILLSLYVGFKAPFWRATHAIRAGYRYIATIDAVSETEALLSTWEIDRETT